VLNYMKVWIPLMAILRSLKLHADMQSSILNNVP
jgi:hypothetical protein